MTYLAALLVTLLSESVIVSSVLYKKVTPLRIAAACIIPSLVTHPCLWFLATKIPWNNYATFALVTETIIVLIEAILIWKITGESKKRSFSIALFANIFSILVGKILF